MQYFPGFFLIWYLCGINSVLFLNILPSFILLSFKKKAELWTYLGIAYVYIPNIYLYHNGEGIIFLLTRDYIVVRKFIFWEVSEKCWYYF